MGHVCVKHMTKVPNPAQWMSLENVKIGKKSLNDRNSCGFKKNYFFHYIKFLFLFFLQ